MGAFATTLLVLLVLVTVGVALQALRRPILFRMAVRNARRRPKQTATVIAGLMIGTAIMASAAVAGDSAGSAIQEAVYASLGGVDETVVIDGFPFFPDVTSAFSTDGFDAVAPNVIWSTAATNPRTDLFEPDVGVIGFDPERDAGFGAFLTPDGPTMGRGLGPREAIVHHELADALDLRLGDTIDLAYTLPIDPVLPTITPIEGTLSGFALGDTWQIGLGPYDRMTVVVAWEGPGHLALEAAGPNGTFAAQSTPVAPANPLWLNVTGGGAWNVSVRANLAADTAYRGAIVVLSPVYDLDRIGGSGHSIDDLPFDLTPRRTATYTVVAITTGGRGDQFEVRGLFVQLGPWQELLEREGQVNVIKFSNDGPARNGAAGTDAAMASLTSDLEALRDTTDDPAIAALKAEPLKQDYLRLADDASAVMTSLLLFAGSLSILTGLLLIVNIFTMLAEERRGESGMARAVGLTRRGLVRLFVFEGSLYAVAAAAVGAVLGIGLAYAMVQGLNALMAGAGPNRFPPIPFVVEAGAVLAAFAAGALLTFITLFLAASRASRLNIVRAIRQIEEPERSSRPWMLLGFPLAAAGLVATILGWYLDPGKTSGALTLIVAGPLAIAIGLGLALRRFLRRRHLDPPLAAALALGYIATYFLIDRHADLEEANVVGPVRGVLLTLCIVLIVAYWERGSRALGRGLSRIRRLRATALPAMSYPQHKRFRTGMTLAMFSLVILSIGFFSIFGALFQVDPGVMTGGFDIEATTTLDVGSLAPYDRGLLPAGTLGTLHRLADFRTPDVKFITVEGQRTGHYGPPVHHVYGYDEAFVADQEFRLLWRDDAYATDREAYLDVLARDDIVIVAYQYSTSNRGQDLSFEVGDTLTMHAGTPRSFTIVGIQEQWHFPGVFLGRDLVEGLFSTDDLYLARLGPAATDAGEVAKLLEKNYRDVGLDAEASKELVAKEQETFRQILGAMKLFLGLGLVVGVLSLGIITSRSVLERRQEIGMLRAIGYTARQVRTMFLLEVTAIVTVGALIGLACSIIVTYGLWFSLIRELQYPYVVPWAEVLMLVAVAYVVALLATLAPIRRSARIPPAEAVRYVE